MKLTPVDYLVFDSSALLLCQDESGAHWTLATGDPECIRLLREEAATGLQLPKERFPIERSGWPADWCLSGQRLETAVAAALLAHDAG